MERFISKKIAGITALLVSGIFLLGALFAAAGGDLNANSEFDILSSLDQNFGVLEVGDQKSLMVKLRNNTDKVLNFNLARQTHPYFSAKESSQVNPGTESSIVLKFQPLTEGDFTGDLVFEVPELADQLLTMKVAGTVLPKEVIAAHTTVGGEVKFLSRSLDFLTLPLGRYEEQTVVVENQSTVSKNLKLAVEGNNAAEFVVANPNFTLAAGARKTILVTFKPSYIGAKSADLVLSDSNNQQIARIAVDADAVAKDAVSRNLVSLLNFTQLTGPDYIPVGGDARFNYALNYTSEQISGFVEKDGVVLASLKPDYQQGQTGTFYWNGFLKDGTQAKAGRYRVVIDAYSRNYGAAVTTKVFTIGEGVNQSTLVSTTNITTEGVSVTDETGDELSVNTVPVFTNLQLTKSGVSRDVAKDYARFTYDLLEDAEVQILVKSMPQHSFVTWVALPKIKQPGSELVLWDAREYVQRGLLTPGFYELTVVAKSRLDNRVTTDSVYVVVTDSGDFSEVDSTRRPLDGDGFPENAPIGVNTEAERLSNQILDTELTRIEAASLMVALLDLEPTNLPNDDSIDFGFDDLAYNEEWLVSPMKHFMAITLRTRTDSTGVLLKTIYEGYIYDNELKPDQAIVRSEYYKVAAESFYNQNGGTNLVLDRNPKEFCVADVSAANPTWYMPYVEMLCEDLAEGEFKEYVVGDGTFNPEEVVTIREALLFMLEAKKLGWW